MQQYFFKTSYANALAPQRPVREGYLCITGVSS
jgi:hypothetical protein